MKNELYQLCIERWTIAVDQQRDTENDCSNWQPKAEENTPKQICSEQVQRYIQAETGYDIAHAYMVPTGQIYKQLT